VKVASDTNPRQRLVGRFTEDDVPEKLDINDLFVMYGVPGGEAVINSSKPIRTTSSISFLSSLVFTRFFFQRYLKSLGRGYVPGDVLEFCADQSDTPLRIQVMSLRPTGIISFADDSAGWEPGDVFSNQDGSAWFEVRSVDSNGKILDMEITFGVFSSVFSYYRTDLSYIFSFSQVPPQNRIVSFNQTFFNDSEWNQENFFISNITQKNVINHPRTFPSFIECDFGVAETTVLQQGSYRRLTFQEYVEEKYNTISDSGGFSFPMIGDLRRSLNWSGGSGTGFSYSASGLSIHILSSGFSDFDDNFEAPGLHLVGKFAYPATLMVQVEVDDDENPFPIFQQCSGPDFSYVNLQAPSTPVVDQQFIVETLETQTIKEPSSGQVVLARIARSVVQTATAISAEGSKFIVQTPDGNKKISIKNERSFIQGNLIGRRFGANIVGTVEREFLQKLTDAIPGIDVERTSRLVIL
jgi:hypothetical protein